MDPNTTLNPSSRLLITWLNSLRVGISHLSTSGIVVHSRFYTSHWFYFSVIFSISSYFLSLFVGWSLFFVFVFMSLESSLSNQEPILTCLLSYWLILCNDFLFSIAFYYSLPIFIFILLLVLLSPFKFYFILCCICCFISYLFYCIYYHLIPGAKSKYEE